MIAAIGISRGMSFRVITSHLCVLGFSLAVLVFGGIELFRARWESGQMMSSLGIRKAWFYLVLPLSGILICPLASGRLLSALKASNERKETP